ncbi:pyridoxal-phosphate dependent enzyme [Stappia sp. GBMRC 2046]|uniref:Pyridoxal-phosphate dependent enzyme n=1 Tax=Stappia sediminis TaxID=2692190 RepID=A0A7X3LTM5_9HYPH|nr:threonine/serine dehydratase [Stappia sediminis]MXN64871.1 pyridoxal-phosphate dependent enzyme [Stappia sediminis]
MLVSPEDIATAYRRIHRHVRRTPVMESGAGSFGLDRSVSLKLELFQHSGSFKARGAFNNLLSREVPAAGIAAASGGNHGAAVAYAARALGKRADIFVPETSSPAKIAKIRSFGANLHIEGQRYADAAEVCERHREETGAIDIHPYDAVETIAGQGTVALEWGEQVPDLDTVLVAVGGGGLISGVATWFDGKVKVVGVEPVGSCSLQAALDAGGPVDVDVESVAADSLGSKRCGDIAYAICKDRIDRVVLVGDDAIVEAQSRLWMEAQIAAEPGGATALAALSSHAYRPQPGERVGVLVCGGNVDPSTLAA